MEKKIEQLLKKIEDSHQVRIIYASEVGSRAWNLSHLESDYDIRFLFVYSVEKYLQLDPPKDVITVQDSMFDCTGWDIRKALQLMKKHNPSLLEWLNSPIVYRNSEDIKSNILNIYNKNFVMAPYIFHYVKMATKNLAELHKRKNSKQLINIIRPILVGKWIHHYHSFPSETMSSLLQVEEATEVKEFIKHVINVKRGMEPEVSLTDHIYDELSRWSEMEINLLKEKVNAQNEYKSLKDFKMELNELFRWLVLHK